MSEARDYSSISPSALSLLVMKAASSIPFSKEAAALLWGDTVPSDLADATLVAGARSRLRHFESRYRSLDILLHESRCKRVLEIGAGLSFRGLDLARRSDTFYVDSDLPEIVALKTDLVAQLHPEPLIGTLQLRSLDALDRAAFDAVVDGIPSGPLAIANEGLLAYLGDDEKARLAANVHRALCARGGIWLTADVYIRHPKGAAPTVGYGRSRKFLEQHRIEENKFADWAAAERFFESHGFSVVTKLAHRDPRHVRESWALAVDAKR